MNNSSIGELLKRLRQEKKLSLRDAGDLSGISHTYISAIEKNKRPGSNTPINPTPETLKRLAQAYDYPYSELLKVAGYIDKRGDIEDAITDDEYRKIERFARNLTPKDRKKALRILEATFEDAFDEDEEDEDDDL